MNIFCHLNFTSSLNLINKKNHSVSYDSLRISRIFYCNKFYKFLLVYYANNISVGKWLVVFPCSSRIINTEFTIYNKCKNTLPRFYYSPLENFFWKTYLIYLYTKYSTSSYYPYYSGSLLYYKILEIYLFYMCFF